MMLPEDPLSSRAAQLSETVSSLSKSVSGLSLSLEGVEARTTRGERGLRLTILGLALDVVLSIVVLIMGGLLYASNADVKETQAKLEAQNEQAITLRHDALCPLYSLFLGFYSPAAREKFPQGPEAYDHGFDVLRKGARALRCPQSP